MTQLKRVKRENEELKDLTSQLFARIDDLSDGLTQMLEVSTMPPDPKLAVEFYDAKHTAQSVLRGATSANSEREVVALHRFEGFCDGEG